MDNNILVISEKTQRVYLPYKHKDLEIIYKNSNNKYGSFLDVINDLYVLPLNNFKHPVISRFRESYKLIKTKTKNASSLKALSLAFELMLKHNLNPIIIAACRNLDELDIYLDCLEENQLSDFKCFEIKYEYF